MESDLRDALLWRSLVEAPYLRSWLENVGADPMDEQVLREFMQMVIRRWVLLYNDMATHGNKPGVVKQKEQHTEQNMFEEILREYKSAWRMIVNVFKKKPVAQTEVLPYACLKRLQTGEDLTIRTEAEEEADPKQAADLLNACAEQVTADPFLVEQLMKMTHAMQAHMQETHKRRLQTQLESFALLPTLEAYMAKQSTKP